MFQTASRLVASLLVALAALSAVPVVATAVPAPVELVVACALKSNGSLRYAASADACGASERPVQVRPGPVTVCVQPSGSVRLVTRPRDCKSPARTVILPPTGGPVFFCAATGSGRLRLVGAPTACTTDEFPVQSTPNDAAPTVTGTTPAAGATQVATTTAVSLQFSENVDAAAGAVSLRCDTVDVTGALTGSGTSTLVFTPAAALAAATTCTATLHADQVGDSDTLDPPDRPAADVSFSFTTDAAPSLVGSTPAAGATGVAVDASIVLDFSEPVSADAGAFVLSCAPGAAAVPATVTGQGTAQLTVDPDAALPAASACTLAVTGALVHDTDAGDPPDTMAADASVSFTTADAAPTVVSTAPADGATGIAAGAQLTVTFSEPVTAAAGAITLACNAVDVPGTLSGSPGVTLTFAPSGPLPGGQSCTATVHAASISDSDVVDPPDTPASDVTFSFGVQANGAPTDLALSTAAVAENSASGTTVGTFSTTDPDAGDTFTYTLVAGAGDTDNARFAVAGNTLATASVFDFETTPSASVRVRTTDSAGNTFEKAFTVTITNANDAPTSVTLTASSVAENQPAGTAVGTLAALDPDAGQTHTFALVTDGCGSTFADSAAFAVSGTALQTGQAFDAEAQASWTVCVRTTDNGTPPLSVDQQFVITVTNVNEAPAAAPHAYAGVVGNTLAALGVTPAGPVVALSGSLLGAGASDPEGATPTVVAETVASAKGGTATIGADGSFTYLPPLGVRNTTDTFTYRVSDGSLTGSGTATMTLTNSMVWYVDNAASTVGADGRSTSPLTGLTTLNAAGGIGDPDAAGDVLFVRTGSGSYAGGLRLEASQVLLGSPAGLSVGGVTLAAASGTAPVLTNGAGNGLDLAEGASVQGVAVTGASGDGIAASGIGSATVGTTSAVAVSASGGDGVDVSGGSGTLTIGASVTGSTGRAVTVSGRTGGTASFTGALAGTQVALAGNTGATVAFSGTLTLSAPAAASAFTATGGGTVTATGTGSVLTGTTGTTLVVEGTSIGSAGLRFQAVSANGAPNGIRLANTGTAGGLTVTGTGSAASGGDASGGTIQNTTAAGVSLLNTASVSLNNLTIRATPNGPGVAGSGVTGFAFTRGTITDSGLTSRGALDSNVSFADPAVAGNVAGTITSLTLARNTITSSTDVALTDGLGIAVELGGTSATVAGLGGGTLSGNTIRNFPDGGGIRIAGGNITSPSAPAATIGTAGSRVTITGNSIRGSGTTTGTRMNLNCVRVELAGTGTGFVDVTANGTAGDPLTNVAGTCISVDAQGTFDLTTTIDNNVVVGAGMLPSALGIAGGADALPAWGAQAPGAVLRATVTNNRVSQTGASGIYLLANTTSTVRTRIEGNTVGGPVGGGGSYGIRVMAGINSSATNATVCAQIANNAATGGLTSSGDTAEAIGLREQATGTNTLGLVGLSPSPATPAETVTYVTAQNPTATAGTNGAKVFIIAGAAFTSCTL